MTNAIEQSKREMLEALKELKYGSWDRMPAFEDALEDHLDHLRQDQEALHETARKRFEDIQSLEQANRELCGSLASVNNTIQICASHSLNTIRDLEERLANMTAERDHLRNRQQASDHAYKERDLGCSTSGQTSGDRVSCATLDGKTAAILGALVDAQRVMTDYLVPDGIRAKDAIGKMIPILDNERLYTAMREFESPPLGGYAAWFLRNTQCMHSFPSGEQCVFCGVGK
jgi:hypothetical protein